MKKTMLLAALALAAIVGVAMLVSSSLKLQASNKLLSKIRLVQPGISLATVTNQLGPPMYERTNIDEVIDFGTIKDRVFCTGKKLYWFYASTPPCRVLEVYTDTNGVVVYVTWQGL